MSLDDLKKLLKAAYIEKNHGCCDSEEVDPAIDFVIDYLHAQGRIVPDGFTAVPLEPTGPMIMYGIHAHEKNDDLPDIGLGPKCVGIYKSMIKGVRHE